MNPSASATRAGGLSKASPSRPVTAQFGVEYTSGEGDTAHTYVAAMLNRTAAESVLAAHSLPGWLPRAVRVVRRDVGEWTPAPSPTANEGSGPTAVTHPKGHTA